MNPFQITTPSGRSQILWTLTGILFSGICWYAAFDLSFHAWWALWLAPIPVLYLSLQTKGLRAFGIAFLAFLIGRLSWFSYLHSVLPLPPVLIFTIFFPLAFGLVIIATRSMAKIAPPAVAILVYPVLWTAFEYLQFLFSRDGTIASIAYTQSDFLPIVQIASVTGVLGITFLVCFVPSVITFSFYYHQQGKKVRHLILPAGIVMIAVLTFGWIRLYTAPPPGNILIGQAAISRKSYGNDYDPRSAIQLSLAQLHLQEVRSLADSGAKVIILPEKGIPVSDSSEPVIKTQFQEAARNAKATIIVGVTRLYKDHPECQAWVFSPEGQLLLNYRKVNLFEGEVMDGFVPGKDPGYFNLDGNISGVAICKDLDYERYSSRYRRLGASILYVPAWDFGRDGWLHSRIAMMRAVENGYTLVRNAQQGRLTISDDRGRVTAEANCENGKGAFLTGTTGPSAGPSLYSRWGNWFGWLDLIVAAYFLVWRIIRRLLVPVRTLQYNH